MPARANGNDTQDRVDVFTSEIIKNRLYQVSEEATIALENAAANLNVSSGHDMVTAIYNSRGELLHTGATLLNHPSCASRVVKRVIDYFGYDEIYSGDIIMVNDPYSGALHTPDVFIIRPIHHEGRLVAFFVSFVHVSDTGSRDPGGFSPGATDCFQEGFQTPGLKLLEKGEYRQDVWDTIMNMSRVPDQTLLDYKCQLAAGHVAEDKLFELFDEYGAERAESVFDDLIRETEYLFRQRLLGIPDGIYRARKYYDFGDNITPVQLAAVKKGDHLTLDLAGTGPQSAASINCTLEATEGGLLPSFYTLLAWDLVWNEGLLRCVDVTAPESSLVNCTRPAPTSCASVGIVTMLNSMGTQVVSKMVGATESMKDRATGDWLGVHSWASVHGLLPDGTYTVSFTDETYSGAGGGRAFKDGIDTGGDTAGLTASVSNIEELEAAFPIIYLYRHPVPDSGGPGKYRGGVSHEYSIISHGSPDRKFRVLNMPGCGIEVPPTAGVFGGLPGATALYTEFRRSNSRDYPSDLASCRAEEEEHMSFGGTEIDEEDIFYVRRSGSGGYGDPLDRDPALVLDDVLNGLVTPAPARDVYGVVIHPGGHTVDEEATARLRKSLRADRLGGHEPSDGSATRADVPASGARIGEYLQVLQEGGQRLLQCTYCGERIASGTRWKDSVPQRKCPVSAAGPSRKDNPDFSMLQYFCPCCATQLDVDLIHQDDPPVHDEISLLEGSPSNAG